MLGQVTGAGLAALLAVFVYGRGPFLLDEEQRANYYASYMGGGATGGRQSGSVYQPLMGSEGRSGAPQGTSAAMPTSGMV